MNSHLDYLVSPLWRSIRGRILARDRNTCQACGRMADTVHHKSYDREVLTGNRDVDLISLCNSCHESIEFSWNGTAKVKNTLKKANEKLAWLISHRSKTPPPQANLPPLTIRPSRKKQKRVNRLPKRKGLSKDMQDFLDRMRRRDDPCPF